MRAAFVPTGFRRGEPGLHISQVLYRSGALLPARHRAENERCSQSGEEIAMNVRVALRASLFLTIFGAANTTFAAAVEEIVITAQKREESLMDVPQSVQAFETSFIENNNVRDLVDAVNFVPGASASFSGGAGSQLYNMRGTGAQGRIGQIAIGFYIDDIPWIGGGPFGPPVRLFDMESLEVLRGPQGT